MRKESTALTAIRRLLLVLLCALLLPAAAGAELKVVFMDVGQGDAILVLCDGESMLVDAGPAEAGRQVNRYLKDTLEPDALDYVVATHGHDDHIAGMPDALAGLSVGKVWSSPAVPMTWWLTNVLPAVRQNGIQISKPAPMDSFRLGNATVTFVNPLTDAENANDASLVLRIEYGGNTVLLAADIETTAEQAMLDSGVPLEAGLLKVPHHGGNTSCSEAFIRAVAPEIAVISVGEGNPHGHPHAEPLRNLEKNHVTVYRTDLFGTVVCTGDGEKWTVEVTKAR